MTDKLKNFLEKARHNDATFFCLIAGMILLILPFLPAILTAIGLVIVLTVGVIVFKDKLPFSIREQVEKLTTFIKGKL